MSDKPKVFQFKPSSRKTLQPFLAPVIVDFRQYGERKHQEQITKATLIRASRLTW